GIYVDTIRYVSGCDSLVTTTHLTAISLKEINHSQTICEGSNYTMPWGEVASSEGTYTHVVKSTAGCDSIKTSVDLFINKVTLRNVSASICATQNYTLPSGVVVSGAGNYADTIRYVSGCDSLITRVALQINPVTRTHIRHTICEGQSYRLPSGINVSEAGLYVDTLRYSSGCDSLITTTELSRSEERRVGKER